MKREERLKRDEGDQIQFERDLRRAMRLDGLLLPETEEEVKAAEAEGLAGAPPLELRDARAVLKRVKRKRKAVPIEHSDSREIEENLARAAREGGKIPPDVEKAMQHDRQAAERKRYGS